MTGLGAGCGSSNVPAKRYTSYPTVCSAPCSTCRYAIARPDLHQIEDLRPCLSDSMLPLQPPDVLFNAKDADAVSIEALVAKVGGVLALKRALCDESAVPQVHPIAALQPPLSRVVEQLV